MDIAETGAVSISYSRTSRRSDLPPLREEASSSRGTISEEHGRTVPTWRRRVEMELEGLEAYRRRTEWSRAEGPR